MCGLSEPGESYEGSPSHPALEGLHGVASAPVIATIRPNI